MEILNGFLEIRHLNFFFKSIIKNTTSIKKEKGKGKDYLLRRIQAIKLIKEAIKMTKLKPGVS